MNELSHEDIRRGLECYDPENKVFPEIAKRCGDPELQPKLSKREVLLIMKWKLGRIRDVNVQTVAEENLDKINEAVKLAREDGRELDALRALEIGIPGVRLAAATAILTVCYPERFSIIDRRVLEQLKLFPSSTADWTAELYMKEYLPKVKEKRAWDCSLRDTDRALWGLSVNKQIENCIAESKQT